VANERVRIAYARKDDEASEAAQDAKAIDAAAAADETKF
jgi:hypothetical protein